MYRARLLHHGLRDSRIAKCVTQATQQWPQQKWKRVIKLRVKEEGEGQTTECLRPSSEPVKDMKCKTEAALAQHHPILHQ